MIAAMSDSINSVSRVDTIVNDSLSDKSDNVICEEPVLAGKAYIDDDVTKWPLPDKVDKMEMNVPHEIPKNKDHMECKGVKLPKESSVFTEMRNSKSATIISERKCNQNFFVSAKECKIPQEINHNCAYNLKGELTSESLADAVCYLNAEMLSCKLTLSKIDKNVESFLKTEMMAEKPTTGTPSTTVHILDEFPITNLNDLEKLEDKLKKDKTFHSKVVDALHLRIKEESIQKNINSVLRMVLDDELASGFTWKNQRGTKLKLSKRPITKIMIEAVNKECPTIDETTFGKKAGPWLSQAIFRIIKHSNNDEAYPDDNSSENCESDDDDEDQKSDEEKNLP